MTIMVVLMKERISVTTIIMTAMSLTYVSQLHHTSVAFFTCRSRGSRHGGGGAVAQGTEEGRGWERGEQEGEGGHPEEEDREDVDELVKMFNRYRRRPLSPNREQLFRQLPRLL